MSGEARTIDADMRTRIVRMHDAGLARKQIATACRVSDSSVLRILRQHGEFDDQPHLWPPDRFGDIPDTLRLKLYGCQRYDDIRALTTAKL